MQLLFFWTKSYRNLKNLGFNLSNKDRFHYAHETKQLTINPAANYIDNFFGENIKQVTGIFGENGSGKTNALRQLMENLVSGYHSKIKDALVIYGDGKKYYLYSAGLEVVYDQKVFKKVNDIGALKDQLSFIFYANHFDAFNLESGDTTATQLQGQENISTSYLLRNDSIARINQDQHFSFDETIRIHNKSELNRQVRLYRKYQHKELLVGPPEYLVISLSDVDEEHLLVYNGDIVKNLDLLKPKSSANKKDLFLFNMFKALLLNLLNHANFSISTSPSFFSRPILESLESFLKSDTAFSLQMVQEFSKKVNTKIDELLRDAVGAKVERIATLLSLADRLIIGPEHISNNQRDFYINILKDPLERINRFFDVYLENEMITQALDFRFARDRWGQNSLSSGEHAFFSLFARLNGLTKKDLKRNLVILLDEAEISLHPHWQVMFLKTLLDFLNKEFRERQIQLILTSHSPFIVSDLPSNCIILLEKINDQTQIRDKLSSSEQTFGANIHQLFLERFFMKDSLMGEFARVKIDQLANEIFKAEKFTLDAYNDYKLRVEMIGEPFLRAKLLEKLIAGAPISELDKIIALKRSELELLISRKND
ncbi:AAA15 family ATPase/GTPase [Mucilaginibacter sp. UYNi724]